MDQYCKTGKGGEINTKIYEETARTKRNSQAAGEGDQIKNDKRERI
jgi:hypothetical protein